MRRSETRRPTTFFSTYHTTRLLENVKAPITTTPSNWVKKLTSGLKMPTARVPQMPFTKCTERAPTGSSMRSLSHRGTANTTITPATAPINNATPTPEYSGPAVMPPNPESAPLSTMDRSIFL